MSLGSVRFLTSAIFLPVLSASRQQNSWPSGFTKHFLTYKDKMYYLEQLGSALLEEFRTISLYKLFLKDEELGLYQKLKEFLLGVLLILSSYASVFCRSFINKHYLRRYLTVGATHSHSHTLPLME